MRADALVVGVLLRAAGIAGDGVGDALDVLEHGLHAPEAAAGEHGGLEPRGRRGRLHRGGGNGDGGLGLGGEGRERAGGAGDEGCEQAMHHGALPQGRMRLSSHELARRHYTFATRLRDRAVNRVSSLQPLDDADVAHRAVAERGRAPPDRPARCAP